jgi:hypothetical protein
LSYLLSGIRRQPFGVVSQTGQSGSKKLGVKISDNLLSLADEVIE